MSRIAIAGAFKQKLCMGKTWSCGAFRAVTAAKGADQEELCLVCIADSLQEVLVAVPARQDKGLSALVTRKPLKNDTAKFAKYFPWWQNITR